MKILRWILAFIVPVFCAGGFNYWSQRLQGKSDEYRVFAEEIGKIKKDIRVIRLLRSMVNDETVDDTRRNQNLNKNLNKKQKANSKYLGKKWK